MFEQLPSIKKGLTTLHDILQTLLSIWQLIAKHPIFFGTLGTLALAYLALDWYVFDYPMQVVERYNHLIQIKDYDRAWNLIEPNYRAKRWANIKVFKTAYSTEKTITNLTVSYSPPKPNLIKGLFATTLKYTESFRVTEIFTKDDLIDSDGQPRPEMAENILWLQIFNQNKYENLIKGTINSFPLERDFKKEVVLKKVNGEWKIALFTNLARGLVPEPHY